MRPALVGLLTAVAAVPRITFPFNAQVPPVARIAQSYRFQFAAATFGGAPDISYSLVDAPAWLRLEGLRVLSGTPTPSDEGIESFGIRATDRTGSVILECTLAVTAEEEPLVATPLQNQLSGRSSSPGTLSVAPGAAFTQQFDPRTFSSGSSTIRAYYAVLADRTPLPAWLHFNPTALSFFGVAPAIGNGAQVFTVIVIASDEIGFSGAETAFTIRVGRQSLVFDPQREEYTVDGDINIPLAQQIYLDSDVVSRDQIIAATLFGPAWLTLIEPILTITGQVPEGFTYQEASLLVQDRSGNLAQKSLILRKEGTNNTGTPRSGNVFPSVQISNLTTRPGEELDYALPRVLVNRPDFQTTVTLDPPLGWLSYNANRGNIIGSVPDQTNTATIRIFITLTTSSGTSNVETFFIVVEDSNSGGTGETDTSNTSSQSQLSDGELAAIVIGTTTAVILLILLAVYMLRKRRQRLTIDKSYISQPSMERHDPWLFTPRTETTISATPKNAIAPRDQPPQIHLEVPNSPMKPIPSRTSRISTASSLGRSTHISRAGDTVGLGMHHNYSFAHRLSTPGMDRSNTNRTVLQDVSNRYSRASVNSPFDLKSQIASHHNAPSIQTNMLSRTSTYSRPPSVLVHPPMRSALDTGRSIRFVAPSVSQISEDTASLNNSPPRRPPPAAIDRRSILEKRQSFVKNRASSGVASQLFATATLDERPDESLQSPPDTRHKPTIQRRRSASSSLEIPIRNPLRLQQGQTPRVLSVARPQIPGALPPQKDNGSSNSSQYADTDEEIRSSEEEEERRKAEGDGRGSTTLPPGPRRSRVVSRETPRRLREGQTPRVLAVAWPRIPGASTPNWSVRSFFVNNNKDDADDDDDDARSDTAWIREVALPRSQRNWVVPGEASPTPPPETPKAAAWKKQAKRLKRGASGEVLGSSPLDAGEGLEVIEPRRGVGREVLGLISNGSIGRGRSRTSGTGDKSGSAARGKRPVRKGTSGGGGETMAETGGLVMKRVREREREQIQQRVGSGKAFI